MSTGRDLIVDSLKAIGAIGSGTTASAAEVEDGRRVMNRMLDSWSAEGISICRYVREVFTLFANTSSYSMGVDGDFNTERAVSIYKASISEANFTQGEELTPFIPGDPLADPPTEDIPATYATIVNSVVETPLEILNTQRWAQVLNKIQLGDFPCKMYVEQTAPLLTIKFWPVPNKVSAVVLYSQKPIAKCSDINEEIDLAPGYEDAIVNNLAIRLAPMYGIAAPAEIIAAAQSSKENISRNTFQPSYMQSDVYGLVGNRRPLNIYSGK